MFETCVLSKKAKETESTILKLKKRVFSGWATHLPLRGRGSIPILVHEIKYSHRIALTGGLCFNLKHVTIVSLFETRVLIKKREREGERDSKIKESFLWLGNPSYIKGQTLMPEIKYSNEMVITGQLCLNVMHV